MERSIASLTHKGSVSDAIAEAQKQKKLFVVYISGNDEDSRRLEQSTWVDDSVGESISKYCIFLHLINGSIDVLQFSAIYPQKSVPSITAVGYNGVMLWQHEGYINGENFVGSIEKAWATLHLQDTAVTLLTAALASKKPEPLNSSSRDIAEGSSSGLDIASTSTGKSAESLEDSSLNDSKLPEDRPVSDSKLPEGQMVTEPEDQKNTAGSAPETSSQSGTVADIEINGDEQAYSENNTRGEVLCGESRDVLNPLSGNDVDVSIAPKESTALDESCTEASAVSMKKATACSHESSQIATTAKEEKAKNQEVAEPTERSKAMKSDDIYLSIRLPNGANLQRKFTMMDTLRSVKNYVDENQISDVRSYDLAVPYPRKVFNEQDMNTVLSELGFAARQALIVVPHRQAALPQRGTSSLHDNQNVASQINSTDENGSYFAFVRRVLGYVNPFSYLGGSASATNSEPAPSEGYQIYRPDPAFQGQQRPDAVAPSGPFGQNQQNLSSDSNTGEIRRRTSRPFGSNVHTLRHDEDDFQSRDRNTFWNGNSTQFGGDDKK